MAQENVPVENIYVTGNTVIDSALWTASQPPTEAVGRQLKELGYVLYINRFRGLACPIFRTKVWSFVLFLGSSPLVAQQGLETEDISCLSAPAGYWLQSRSQRALYC
jgi:hypothetical protein